MNADQIVTFIKSQLSGVNGWVHPLHPLIAPLTSTAWDGDAYSTTAKTLIDLSAVFGVPAGAKAVLLRITARDSGSAGAASGTCWFGAAPNNTSGSLPVCLWLASTTNDYLREITAVVPCDANGDIYYQNNATGAGTMDVWLEIWAYWL